MAHASGPQGLVPTGPRKRVVAGVEDVPGQLMSDDPAFRTSAIKKRGTGRGEITVFDDEVRAAAMASYQKDKFAGTSHGTRESRRGRVFCTRGTVEQCRFCQSRSTTSRSSGPR